MQQFVFDDYTKCKGLTQEEMDQDIKLLKLSEYTSPSTKYKISNPISKQKREIITSIYDKKNISLDLAKQNNQLISELNSLKRQIQKIKDEIIHNQSQITISKLQKEIVQRQFKLIQETKNKQIESLKQYHLQSTNSIRKTQDELKKFVSMTTSNITTQQKLNNALQTIENLKKEVEIKQDIINNTNNQNNNNNNNNLKLNDKFNKIQKQYQQQQRRNNVCNHMILALCYSIFCCLYTEITIRKSTDKSRIN